MLRKPTFIVGALILLFWIFCAVFGTAIAPHNPLAQQLLATNAPPSGAHLFGTDQLGRDVLSRVLAGSREILLIAAGATVLGTLLGTALGLLMGYLGGVLDILVGRVVEAVLALPLVIVAFLFIVALGPSALNLIVVIGFVFTPLIARTVRSAVLVESQLDYLSSARLLGEKSGQIMFTEILPNVRAGHPRRVHGAARLRHLRRGHAVVPGLRGPAADPRLGGGHRRELRVLPAGYWWETLFPALAIASLIVAVNLVDRLDRAGAGLVTAADTTAAPGAAGGTAPALAVEHLDVTYRVRGQDRRALRDVTFEIGQRRVLRAGRRVRIRQVHGGPRADPVPAPQRPGERGHDQHQRDGPAGHGLGGAARPAGPHGVHGLPGARAGAEPVDQGGPPGGRGLRDRRPGPQARRWRAPRTCCARCRSPTRAG